MVIVGYLSDTMVWIRSLLFLVAAIVWTVFILIAGLPALVLPRRAAQTPPRLWTRGLIWLVGVICGLHYRIEGRQAVPSGGILVASKHQSAWDTLIFHSLFDEPVFVMKRELLRIPIMGWYMSRAGNIGIDRSAGYGAIKKMIPRVGEALACAKQVIVFPEGTRAAPGVSLPYHPGIAALYLRFDAPLVPVALNSGVFWSRRSLLKYPGVITLEFLPPIPPGLDRRAFLGELNSRIEQASQRLLEDGRKMLQNRSPCPPQARSEAHREGSSSPET